MPDHGALEGGCLCGAVRFRIDAVHDAGYCHCSQCRRTSGAPFVAWVNLRASDFHLLAGEPTAYRSSESWVRYFCDRCGSPVHQRAPDGGPDDLVCILIPCLDDPERVRPTVHVWCSAALSAPQLEDGLPRYPEGELPAPAKRGSGDLT